MSGNEDIYNIVRYKMFVFQITSLGLLIGWLQLEEGLGWGWLRLRELHDDDDNCSWTNIICSPNFIASNNGARPVRKSFTWKKQYAMCNNSKRKMITIYTPCRRRVSTNAYYNLINSDRNNELYNNTYTFAGNKNLYRNTEKTADIYKLCEVTKI